MWRHAFPISLCANIGVTLSRTEGCPSTETPESSQPTLQLSQIAIAVGFVAETHNFSGNVGYRTDRLTAGIYARKAYLISFHRETRYAPLDSEDQQCVSLLNPYEAG